MFQKSLWDIVKYFPLRFLGFNHAPYYIHDGGGDEIGSSRQSLSEPEYIVSISQDVYTLRAHSGKKHSLTRDGRQIARFFMEYNGKICIDFAEQDHDLIPLLLLFAIFIDVQDYAHKGRTVYTFVPGDKQKERSNWTPESTAVEKGCERAEILENKTSRVGVSPLGVLPFTRLTD